jgi:hypothetical protein
MCSGIFCVEVYLKVDVNLYVPGAAIILIVLSIIFEILSMVISLFGSFILSNVFFISSLKNLIISS